MSDIETISIYNQRVGEYAALANPLQEQAALDRFVELLAPDGLLLDLGCGPGAAATYLAEQGFRVDAIDASDEMIRLARAAPGVNAYCADFSEIDAVADYDGVWANFSLLHTTPEEFPVILSALHRALKPGGIFHIGMKLGEGSGRDNLGRYYSYYSEEGLQTQLQNTGFSVLNVERGKGAGLAGTVDPWILLLCVAASANSPG